jgi:hypothetical protein
MHFRVSSFCTGGGCVEVGHSSIGDPVVVVRDAKDPLRTVSITFSNRAWNTFLTRARNGEYDHGPGGAHITGHESQSNAPRTSLATTLHEGTTSSVETKQERC